ncbi:excinuclease ABC subunit UvrC [Patescibacteria group bacterium]|nr:excinuclease ABC subunit UvrC [Patescibacteria group bacterium]MBU1034292.1 excinuclease ABC subunit UvrC [Patescibacteria group bacterium]MBU1907921.1 excinuclease ABC subunit UvrC [Patescibacteria group bacterium]
MKFPRGIKVKNGELPDSPGVYLMKNADVKIIYVGKASSLKRRVSSYFQRPQDARIAQMVSEIREIDYIQKPTAIEALILEANLIKYYFPPYNVKDKDNKSFLYLIITKEDFPKPLLIRGSDLGDDARKKYKAVFGPYTSPRSLRAALDLIRKAFPWSTCNSPESVVHSPKSGKKPRACFYYHLKLCPGVCIGAISKKEYGKIIRDLIKFFEGKKDDILKQYKKEMKSAAKEKRFEEAASFRNKIFFLEHIQDIAILKREDDDVDKIREGETSVLIFGRVEGYDISNISGTSSVASMAVFEDGAPAKAEYRKFRIKSVAGSNDVASIRETLMRRFRRKTPSNSPFVRGRNWRLPDLILIDGGKPQVNAATQVIRELELGIPVVGLAKGPTRKKDELICDPNNLVICAVCKRHKDLLVAVRDEAHRFAIKYHRKLRGEKMIGKNF